MNVGRTGGLPAIRLNVASEAYYSMYGTIYKRVDLIQTDLGVRSLY